MKNQIKKLIIFLSAVVMLTVVMCLNASAESVTCPENFNGQHQWSAYDKKAPTCEEDGYNKYTCYYCKEEKSEIVPAYGGTCDLVFNSTYACCAWYKCANGQCTTTEIVVVNPDFHEWNEYYSCSERICKVCNTIEAKEVPTHSWSEKYTCFERRCNKCGTTETKDAPTHSWEEFGCVKKCYKCNESQPKEAPTHAWESICDRRYCVYCGTTEYLTEPKHEWQLDGALDEYTCEKYLNYYCGNHCGATKEEINPNPSDHNWDVWDYPDGECGATVEYFCYNCGERKTESNPREGKHEYDPDIVKGETCTEDGLIIYRCYYGCSYERTEVIPATGHTYKNDWAEILAPSCTGQGVKIKVCNECSFVNFETLAALGHTDDDKDGKCDVCKSLLECSGTVTPEAPHEHIFGDWVTEGTLSLRQCECGHMEMKIVTDVGDVEIEYPDSDEGSFEVDSVEGDEFILVEENVTVNLGEGWDVLKAFDINLKNSEGVHVQPDGSVKVKLPLDWEKEGNYKVYRVNDDGSFTDMNAYQQGSHMVFETDHFSVYVIVEEVTVDAPSDTAPEQPKKETNVFDFLINFFNSILDFFKNLFKIK